MSTVIHIENVGPRKMSWRIVLKEPLQENEVLYIVEAEVRKKKALASRGIEAVFDERDKSGMIFVGGFRCVGTFRVTTEAERQEIIKGMTP